MPRTFGAIVIGGGHNGMVCAAYLARAGVQTLVLERRERLGGTLVTGEIEPGVRGPTVAHTVGRIAPSVLEQLRLHEHGLTLIEPQTRAFAPQPDGRAVTLWADPERTAQELAAWSRADAEAYGPFDRQVRALSTFVAHLQATTPLDLTHPSLRDGVTALGLGRAFRSLGARDSATLLRVLPMAVADFVGESFSGDPLRAAIAARAVQYTAMGPWSAGTTAVLLADSANNTGGAAGQSSFARGGPGELATALERSARSFGASLRTRAEVERITTQSGRVTGVALAGGEEIEAPVVVAGVDPKRVLLGLLDPMDVGPNLRWRASNLRMPGIVGKVNLALDALPGFSATTEEIRLTGRILIAPGIDALERAFDDSKYGRISESPYLEITIPSLVDASLAPSGKHVMSVLVQYAPYHLREGSWDARRDELGDLVLRTLETYAPGITQAVTGRQVVTPLDLERDYGLTGGHPLHGEPGLDQFFAWRPLLGHARYRLALDGLYLCGSGAHPGGGVTGGPGANAAREIYADLKRGR